MIENFDFGEGKIVFQSFYIDPKIPLKEQGHLLYEDMLGVDYLEGKYMIEVDWYFGGQCFFVSLAGDSREPFLFEECYNVEQLQNALEKAIKLAHDLLEQPPENEISYRLTFPTPPSVTDTVDQLLGKVEVEWEAKKSNVTEEMVMAVENKWGYLLPEKLKKIVLACNGGGPIPFNFPCEEYGSLYFKHLYSFHPKDPLNIYEKMESLSNYLPEGVFPIGDAEGYESICLDYRNNEDQPKVKVWTVKVEDDEEPVIEEYHVADTFDDFLAHLFYDFYWPEESQKDSPDSLIKKLDQLEENWQITLPHHYKKLILQHHRETPDEKIFYHEKGKGELECFLTIDPVDEENSVLNVYQQYFQGTSYYPFAKCKNDRYLCHDYTKENPGVVLWDAKQDQFYKVKNSFAQFLQYLSYY